MKITDLTLISGVGPALASRLMQHGVTSVSELAGATPERLAEVPGIGRISASQLIAAAAEISQASESDLVPPPPGEELKSERKSARRTKEKTKKSDRKRGRKGKKKDGKKDKKKKKGKQKVGKKGKGKDKPKKGKKRK